MIIYNFTSTPHQTTFPILGSVPDQAVLLPPPPPASAGLSSGSRRLRWRDYQARRWWSLSHFDKCHRHFLCKNKLLWIKVAEYSVDASGVSEKCHSATWKQNVSHPFATSAWSLGKAEHTLILIILEIIQMSCPIVEGQRSLKWAICHFPHIFLNMLAHSNLNISTPRMNKIEKKQDVPPSPFSPTLPPPRPQHSCLCL